jgi:hypothetical protein
MQVHIPTLLKKMMEIVPGGQVGLSKRLGKKYTQPQVSRWLAGQEPLKSAYERILVVARELGVLNDVRSEDVAAMLESAPGRMVKIKGYVGAGAQAHYYALSDEEYEEVEPPAGASDQTVAVEIKGKSFGPLLDSWLVFYDDVRSPVTDDLLGRVCVVGLADDRILIKEIKRERDGSYSLLSNTNSDEPIRNAEIEWAAKVTNIRPRQ